MKGRSKQGLYKKKQKTYHNKTMWSRVMIRDDDKIKKDKFKNSVYTPYILIFPYTFRIHQFF